MNLLDQSRTDAAIITTGPFSEPVNFVASTGENVTINALNNKIGRKVDTSTGLVINSKNASVVFAESVLNAKGFPIRNNQGEVNMLGVLIKAKDNSGVEKDYIVLENIPDETIGLITLMLGDYD